MSKINLVKIVLSLILVATASLTVSGQELVALKPSSEISLDKIITKEQYNSLKKSLGASKIVSETFDDGTRFYVAHKGSYKSLLTDDFKPIEFQFARDVVSPWVYRFAITRYNGKYYVMGASEPRVAVAVLQLDGKYALPQGCVGPVYGFTTSDGKLDMFYGSDYNGISAYYSSMGHLLGVGKEMTYECPKPAAVIGVDDDVKMYKDANPYVFLTDQEDGSRDLVILYPDEKGEYQSKRATGVKTIPGYGYFYFGDTEPIKFRKRLRTNSKGEITEYDEVFIKSRKSNDITLYDTKGNILVGSALAVTISYPDNVVYYVKVNSDRPKMWRKGAVDLVNKKNVVPPAFNEIAIDRNEQGGALVYVKPTFFDDYTLYSHNLDSIYTSLDERNTIFEAGYTLAYDADHFDGARNLMRDMTKKLDAEFASRNITPEDFKLYSVIQTINADAIVQVQEQIVDLYDGRNGQWIKNLEAKFMEADPLNNNLKTYGVKDMDALDNTIDRFREYVKSPECTDISFAALTLTHLVETRDFADYNRKVTVPDARRRYYNYLGEKVKKEQAEAERRRKEEQAAAILKFIGECMPSSTGGSGGYVKSKSAGSSKASVSTSGSSASHEVEDNTGRKVFLREQITQLKHKLHKMEAEYEREMGSGDSRDREKRRVLETKQKNIRDMAEFISQYEAELKSLK